MNPTLHLVLNAHWYREIESGRKSVEYRRICEHWRVRIWRRRHEIETVVFILGYKPDSPRLSRRVTRIDTGPCPYDGWDGDFYRVHFEQETNGSTVPQRVNGLQKGRANG